MINILAIYAPGLQYNTSLFASIQVDPNTKKHAGIWPVCVVLLLLILLYIFLLKYIYTG